MKKKISFFFKNFKCKKKILSVKYVFFSHKLVRICKLFGMHYF